MINEHCGAQRDKMFVLVIPYINTTAQIFSNESCRA